jgi:SAM-dependent methyltransferase
MEDPKGLKRIQTEGRERLYPSLTNPNWLVLRSRRELFTRWLHGLNCSNPRVLDVGGRVQPYRSLIRGGTSLYTAVDLRSTPLVDIVGDAAQLPLADACFDLVLCTQMLEYARDPRRVMSEIYRVLKPGAFLLLSAPAVYPQDSEQEYWRFLPCALRELLRDFSEIDLAAEGNSVIGLIRTVNVCLVAFTTSAVLRKLVCVTLVPALNLLGALVEALKITNNTSFTANFSALARK